MNESTVHNFGVKVKGDVPIVNCPGRGSEERYPGVVSSYVSSARGNQT